MQSSFAAQKNPNEESAGKRGRAGTRPANAHAPLFISRTPTPQLQRKAACACGGGCPRCEEMAALQRKGYLDEAHDPLELEADRAAEQVMKASAPPQRKQERNDEAPTALPSTASDRAEPSALPESVRETLGSQGRPLDVATRGFMEARFGYDFGGIRIHTGGQAATSAREVNALAYTVGRDVVFGAGQYEPGTSHGKRLLAHELAHTVQQNRLPALSPQGAAHPLVSSVARARLSRLKDQSCKPPLYTSAEKIKCHIIENKPPASDAKATEEWKKGLRALFEDVATKDAKNLHDNLSLGPKGDAFAKFFHEQVDTATRDEMLDILKKKFAAPTTPAPAPAPTPSAPATPSAGTALPVLDDLLLNKLRAPTASVSEIKDPAQGGVFIKGSENLLIDCNIKFEAFVNLQSSHVGRIFFRQYIMSLVRKENACKRGPMGVDKGPALDTMEVYNHSAGGGYTGVISATGTAGDVKMIDNDAPAQAVEKPCDFKEGDAVQLYAADKFRLYVMWEPKGGAAVPLGYKEWGWKANGLFNKMTGGVWTKLLTDTEDPRDLSGTIGTGALPSTTDVITPDTIMDGQKSVPPF